jgi:N-acetylmuramoyl-L-alanine amidase
MAEPTEAVDTTFGTAQPLKTGQSHTVRVGPAVHIKIAVVSELKMQVHPSSKWQGHPPRRAELELRGQGKRVTTDAFGNFRRLDVSGVPDGDHILDVRAAAAERHTDKASPSLTPAAGVDFLYRPLEVKLKLKAGKIESASVAPGTLHGSVISNTAEELKIDLKPDWVRSKNHSPRAGTAIDVIVVHHTGSDMAPSLNTWLDEDTAPHYAIDKDGHLIKLVLDSEAASHAGPSRFGGVQGLNKSSIGIEVIHRPGQPFTAEQNTALLDLLNALVTAHGIPINHVVGHSDIATSKTNPTLLDSRRGADPGPEFDWVALETAGIGILPNRTPPADNVIYGGAFAGGKRHPLTSGMTNNAAVRELQTDLDAIGYSVNINGNFDQHLTRALVHFQVHFFALGRARPPSGNFDIETARMVKSCIIW